MAGVPTRQPPTPPNRTNSISCPCREVSSKATLGRTCRPILTGISFAPRIWRSRAMIGMHSPIPSWCRLLFWGSSPCRAPNNGWEPERTRTAGPIGPREYVLPKPFDEFIFQQANRAATLQERISERQTAKIRETFKSNLERVARSITARPFISGMA